VDTFGLSDLIFSVTPVTFDSERALRMRSFGLVVASWTASSPAMESLEMPVIKTIRE
jgi:hypothetical protein